MHQLLLLQRLGAHALLVKRLEGAAIERTAMQDGVLLRIVILFPRRLAYFFGRLGVIGRRLEVLIIHDAIEIVVIRSAVLVVVQIIIKVIQRQLEAVRLIIVLVVSVILSIVLRSTKEIILIVVIEKLPIAH